MKYPSLHKDVIYVPSRIVLDNLARSGGLFMPLVALIFNNLKIIRPCKELQDYTAHIGMSFNKVHEL